MRKVTELDAEWARNVLEWWSRNAAACLMEGLPLAKRTRTDSLRAQEHQTRLVVKRVLGLEKLPTLIAPTADARFVNLGDGIDTVNYALGILATQEETNARLGSAAPMMAADALHPIVWNAAAKLWSDGHYGQAVQRAATFLNAHVQDRLDRHDVSDSVLMQQAFSLSAPEPGKPRLRFPGKDDDLRVRAMRSGILNFAPGCFMAIRNPATHGSDERPRQIWLEQLATLSTLARWIDECEVLTTEDVEIVHG